MHIQSFQKPYNLTQTPKSIRMMVLLLASIAFVPELRFGTSGFFYLPPIMGLAGRAGSPYFFELLIISIFLIYGTLLVKGIPKPKNHFIVLTGSMFFFAVLVIPLSHLLGLTPGTGEFGQVRVIIESFLLFWAVSFFCWDIRTVKLIILITVTAGIFHSLINIISYYNPNIIPFPVNITSIVPFNRYGSIFSQPSRASLLLAVSFVLAALYFLSYKREIGTYLSLVSLPIIGIGLILSQTRAAFLAVILSFTILFFSHRENIGKGKQLGFTALLLIIGVVFWFSGFWEIAFSRFFDIQDQVESSSQLVTVINNYYNEGSFYAQRGHIWETSLRFMIEYPLGMGYDTLISESSGIPHAHNMFLQWGVMFGIPGFTLFIIFLYKLLKNIRWKASKSFPIHKIILYGIFTYLLACLFEPFLISSSGYLFWLLGALGIADIRKV